MSDLQNKPTVDESLRFFGAITASLSHEINNVLAIINELTGLMDDFLLAGGIDQPPDPERQREILARVANQVKRGVGYVNQLNRFAHSPEDEHEEVDATRNFNAITELCLRFAKLRKVEINTVVPEQSVILGCSSFVAQNTIFLAVESALAMCGRGDSLNVELHNSEEGVSVILKKGDYFSINEEAQKKLDTLEGVAKNIEGKIETLPGSESPMELVLHLPALLKT